MKIAVILSVRVKTLRGLRRPLSGGAEDAEGLERKRGLPEIPYVERKGETRSVRRYTISPSADPHSTYLQKAVQDTLPPIVAFGKLAPARHRYWK